MKNKIILLSAVLFSVIIFGCKKKDDASQQSQPTPPVADFTYDLTDHTARTVEFTNTSTHADSYSWQFGDASSSTLASPQHNFPSYSNYTVTLTAYGQGGINTATKTVAITP